MDPRVYRSSVPPRAEAGDRIRTRRAEARLPDTDGMKDVTGPQGDDRMRHRPPRRSPTDPLRDRLGQPSSLGVVRAERLLEIREPGAVLEVEEISVRRGPRNDIPAASELEVLIRLIELDD